MKNKAEKLLISGDKSLANFPLQGWKKPRCFCPGQVKNKVWLPSWQVEIGP